MKNRPLYALFAPEAQNSYWADLIREGIAEGAREWGYTLLALSAEEMPAEIRDRSVLVVGHRADWLENSLSFLSERGAKPVIVNACMLPLHRLRYSGITFELEGMLGQLLSLLFRAGRKKTVLLGTSPSSLSDRVKEDAFLRAMGDAAASDAVFRAEGRLEDCIDRFVANLKQAGWDAVICANDTAAVYLVHRLQSAGVRLPDDLYIVGMGNFYAERMLPLSLTSVMFDYRTMGYAAVELYHNLEKSRTACRMRVSLPCNLVIRGSAPLSEGELALPARELTPPAESLYFTGEAVENIIRTEAMLQASDPADREILYGIARGEDCEKIAERLFFSSRAVRYRLKKLLARFGLRNRAELADILRYVTEGETNRDQT